MKRQAGHVWGVLLLVAVPQLAFSSEKQAAGLASREIDRLLAPVALYPDTLLAQVLTAVTYPEDVAAAARWLETKRNLQGERALQAALAMPWDASVTSLVPFPDLIRQLHREAEWANRTAAVFLGAEPDVLDSIQRLRRLAIAFGALPDRLRAERQGPDVRIEANDHSRLLVPYYDPADAYGPWPWPESPPVRWKDGTRGAGRTWGAPMPAGVLYAGFDWAGRHTHVVSLRLEAGVLALAASENRATPVRAPVIPPVVNAVAVRPAPLVQLGIAPEPVAPSASASLLGAPTPPASSAARPAPPKVPPLVALGRPSAARFAVPPPKAPPESGTGKTEIESALAEPPSRPAGDPTRALSFAAPPAETAGSGPLATGVSSAGPISPGAPETQRRTQNPAVSLARPVRPFHAFISKADRRTLEDLK